MTELADFVATRFGGTYWTLEDLVEAAPRKLLPAQTQYVITSGGSKQAVLISLGRRLRAEYEHQLVAAVVGGRRKLWVHAPSHKADLEPVNEPLDEFDL